LNPTYYTILGISHTATTQEIKLAYKQLALKLHPDKNPGNAHAEEQFKLVNTAYQVLSNPGKRARYDLRLQYQHEQQRRVLQEQAAYYNPRYRHTRAPASVAERHYHGIRTDKQRFSRKDYYITITFIFSLMLFSWLLKVVMDHITGVDKYNTALVYIEDGNYSSARSLLSDAIYFKPGNAAAYKERAKLELQVFDDYEGALADLNQVIALQEKPSGQVYLLRGQSFRQLGRYQQAEADFTSAIRIDKSLWPAYLARGEVRLFYLKTYKAAIADLSAFLQHSKKAQQKVRALTCRGFGYYKTGHSDLSERDYRQALSIEKGNGRVLYLLGRTELEQQRPDSACVHFSKAYVLGYSAALLELRQHCK
jgi:tetratricopeptide (TPR) repeat protein